MHVRQLRRTIGMAVAAIAATATMVIGVGRIGAQAAPPLQGERPPARPAASSDNYLSYLAFDVGTLEPAFI